jgi:superoxide reductase
MVLVVQDGGGTLVCCNQPMIHVQEKHADEGKEKHVPVMEKTAGGIKVKVGSVPHPMADDHYIKWIEVMGDTFLQTTTLKPGDSPEVELCVPFDNVQKIRIFCNKHGFWTNH